MDFRQLIPLFNAEMAVDQPVLHPLALFPNIEIMNVYGIINGRGFIQIQYGTDYRVYLVKWVKPAQCWIDQREIKKHRAG